MKSTQTYLDIAEIKQDTLVLKDGSLRAVFLVSSVNFDLKAEDEQKALISAYVTMLNMLEYPLQILIQSRKMNIEHYLRELEKRARVETNELLKMHTEDYLAFMREIVSIGNIMSKKFYIVAPYSAFGDEKSGFFRRLFGILAPTKVISLREEKFLSYKRHLDKRAENIAAGLASISLDVVRLDTEALIELFYSTYNPDMFESQRIVNMEELQIDN